MSTLPRPGGAPTGNQSVPSRAPRDVQTIVRRIATELPRIRTGNPGRENVLAATETNPPTDRARRDSTIAASASNRPDLTANPALPQAAADGRLPMWPLQCCRYWFYW
ncbi:hypothetical protein [Rhodococcus sp. KRD162]|uniref:hypothetical protein n=1 Tax=Rhodococcus sp. KRD162 TaxID=2729725 RepID=UPI0019CFDA38|nr:hypothetical protein [Rhodococcus sp. KRD162]